MKDSLDLSSKHSCSNEIVIRNETYFISMHVHHSPIAQIDLTVEAKRTAEQWKGNFDVNGNHFTFAVSLGDCLICRCSSAIETMTSKTGNFKSFNVFVNMIENAIEQESASVNIDLFTYEDLEALRKKRQGHSTDASDPTTPLTNKRYLILTYNAEFDRIYYPLSLPYCGKPDPVLLMAQIRQLTAENQ